MSHPPSVLGIHESALYVADLDRAARFYRTVLGFREMGREPGRHVFLRAGRDVLLLFDADATRRGTATMPAHFGAGQLHLAFDIAGRDFEPWRAYLQGAGIAIEAETSWPGGGRSLYLRDPDGHSVELVTRGTWGF